MARGPEDLVYLTLCLTAGISLDMERVEADPIYQNCLATSSSATAEDLLQAYIEHYAIRESLFCQMPSTNGPGSYMSMEIKEVRKQDASS